MADQLVPYTDTNPAGQRLPNAVKSEIAVSFANRGVSLQGNDRYRRMASIPSAAPVMDTPPTVVMQAAATAGNTKSVDYNSPIYSWPCFMDRTGGSAIPRGTSSDTGVRSSGTNATQVAFDFDGAKFDLAIRNNTGLKYRIWVNEKAATAGLVNGTATNALAYLAVDLGTVSQGTPRRIVVELENSSAPTQFYSVQMPPSAVVTAPVITSPRVFIVGDSFGAAIGGTNYSHGYTRALGRLLGWRDTWGLCHSVGTTGLVKRNSATQGPYISRINYDIIPFAPDLVIVQGSLNDHEFVGQGLIGPALTLYVQTLRQALPNVVVVVTSPLAVATPQAEYLTVRTEMAAACTALGVPFVDMLTPEIFSGTGKVGTTTGIGNADWARTSDGTHPTDLGHWMIAQYMATGIAKALGITGP